MKLFGPEELKYIVGGERWWQVRGLSGVESEWITEVEFLDPKMPKEGERKYTTAESNILRMEKLESVMLYVHGGGYSWGSISQS
jgi:carboxylesterase type B